MSTVRRKNYKKIDHKHSPIYHYQKNTSSTLYTKKEEEDEFCIGNKRKRECNTIYLSCKLDMMENNSQGITKGECKT